jgi:HAD superfamily phosphoserine phosphatase-like hydrolase
MELISVPSPAVLAAEILATAEALRAAQSNAVATAFWDFDGTLIEGDCCEGFARHDGHSYPGLADLAVERGFSTRFRGPTGRADMIEAVRLALRTDGHIIGNGFVAQAFAGARLSEMLALAREHFEQVMGPWIFADALAIWRALEAGGIQCHVISASPDFFVKGAASVLGVPEDRLHGSRLAIHADGTLSGDTVPPITYGEGKAARMCDILRELAAAHPHRTFWPVAAFGNCLRTDGPLLDAVASTVLPAGNPLSVLINEPLPADARGRHRETSFAARVIAPLQS